MSLFKNVSDRQVNIGLTVLRVVQAEATTGSSPRMTPCFQRYSTRKREELNK